MQLESPSNQETKIIVYKSARRLELWHGALCLGVYPVGLGRAPRKPKETEGDGRTPEGEYYVCTRNAQSRFYLSLGIAYPNVDDAEKAFKQGRIDAPVYEQICHAIKVRTRQPWHTPLGGAIMIHGGGSQTDWTQGCVAVEDEVMDILWSYAALGTLVLFCP